MAGRTATIPAFMRRQTGTSYVVYKSELGPTGGRQRRYVIYHYGGEMILSYGIWRAHGQGTLTWYAEGGGPGPGDVFSWRYKGRFNEGHATGHGTTTYGDPNPDYPDLAGQVYIGAHFNGKAHGQGIWYRGDDTSPFHIRSSTK